LPGVAPGDDHFRIEHNEATINKEARNDRAANGGA